MLVPGGAMHANAWLALDSNPVHASIDKAVAALFPDDPPRFLDVPYGYHDRARILSDAAAGGFADVQLEEVRVQAQGPSALDYVTGFVRGTPLNHGLTQRGADLDEVARRGRGGRGRPPRCRTRDGRPRRDGDHCHARPLTRRGSCDAGAGIDPPGGRRSGLQSS